MHRRTIFLGASTLFCTTLARAQSPRAVEGTHYTVLQPSQAPTHAGKIEVLEFFSYACPACSAFDPFIDRWSRVLPADVVFRRVPAAFLYNAENFQRTYFALEATGMIRQVHAKIFEAVHVEKRRLANAKEIAEVVARSSGDGAGFLAAFNAFSMGLALARAKAASSNYRVAQLPTIAIAGRFITSPGQAGGAQQALVLTDDLIQKARKA